VSQPGCRITPTPHSHFTPFLQPSHENAGCATALAFSRRHTPEAAAIEADATVFAADRALRRHWLHYDIDYFIDTQLMIFISHFFHYFRWPLRITLFISLLTY